MFQVYSKKLPTDNQIKALHSVCNLEGLMFHNQQKTLYNQKYYNRRDNKSYNEQVHKIYY